MKNGRQAKLTYREAELLKLRFGVNESGESYTRAQCGQIFKVSGDRIRQIEHKAIAKLVRGYFRTCPSCAPVERM